MSGSVTVPGADGSEVTGIFGNGSNFAIAQQISLALAAANEAGNLLVSTVSGSESIPEPTSGAVNELLLGDIDGGQVTIPSGSPGYVVVLQNTGPLTITGGSNTTIFGGAGGQITILDPALITLDEAAGNATATLTGTGDILAGNNFNDTLTAAGTGESIAGGTGTNLLSALGANDTISAQGNNDTLVGGPGSATFIIAPGATNELVTGGLGALFVSDAGSSDTILGGAGALVATVSGAGDTVVAGAGAATVNITGTGSNVLVAGGQANLSVVDAGTSDTINAGQGFTAVTAPGGSLVFGSSGPLNYRRWHGRFHHLRWLGQLRRVSGWHWRNDTVRWRRRSVRIRQHDFGRPVLPGQGVATRRLTPACRKAQHTCTVGWIRPDRTCWWVAQETTSSMPESGADTLVGGGGQDAVLVLERLRWSSSRIMSLVTSALSTSVFLVNYGAGAADAAIAGATTAAGSTTITLSDNTKITFTGVTSSAALTDHIVSN